VRVIIGLHRFLRSKYKHVCKMLFMVAASNVFYAFAYACEDLEFKEHLNTKIFNKNYRVYDKNPGLNEKSKVTQLGLIKDNKYVVAENKLTKAYVRLTYLDKSCQRQEAWTSRKALVVGLNTITALTTSASKSDSVTDSAPPSQEVANTDVVNQPMVIKIPVPTAKPQQENADVVHEPRTCQDSEFSSIKDAKIFNTAYRVYDKNPGIHGKNEVRQLGLIRDRAYVVANKEIVKGHVLLTYIDKNCVRQNAWTSEKALKSSLEKIATLDGSSTTLQDAAPAPTVAQNPQKTIPSINDEPKVEEVDRFLDNPQETAKEICDYGSDLVRTDNCLLVLNAIYENKLPKDPVLYSLKALKGLHGKMCNDRKILNGCMVFVSDIDKTHDNFDYRHPAYFINLCVGDKSRTSLSEVYYSTYTNRGTGSKKDRNNPNYKDFPGMKTTLPGLFMSTVLGGFHPFGTSVAKYEQLLGYSANDANCKEQGNSKNGWLKDCPVLRLTMHRLNGSITGVSKPMHTSPYKSSSGCPSVGSKDNWILRHMAANRTTLYIAYTRVKKYNSYFEYSKVCKE
jgi:hypothetical protein